MQGFCVRLTRGGSSPFSLYIRTVVVCIGPCAWYDRGVSSHFYIYISSVMQYARPLCSIDWPGLSPFSLSLSLSLHLLSLVCSLSMIDMTMGVSYIPPIYIYICIYSIYIKALYAVIGQGLCDLPQYDIGGSISLCIDIYIYAV